MYLSHWVVVLGLCCTCLIGVGAWLVLYFSYWMLGLGLWCIFLYSWRMEKTASKWSQHVDLPLFTGQHVQ